MSVAIEVVDLSFKYSGERKEIIKGINLEVKKGEVLAIVGLSGSGKSTLCFCLSGIIPHIYGGVLSGGVRIRGESTVDMDIAKIATRVGIVFQNPETQIFFPTVEDELAFGPENLCIAREEIGKRIEKVLSLLGMKKKRYERTEYLSGGQKQLIALAAVLTLEPEILIFDEVMAQIDKKGRELIKEMILELKDKGKTVVIVEHNLDNIHIADRKLLLKNGRLKEFAGDL